MGIRKTAKPKTICILGGGFGGLYTALHLQKYRDLNPQDCQIILVDRHDRLSFTPLLYELIADELQPWEIAPSYHKLLKNTFIQFCQDEIRDVDFQARQVTLKERGQLDYDYLVLAVGGQSRAAEIPGLQEHALAFRTFADSQRLEQALQNLEKSERAPIRVTIIGGGPNGVELAGKIADRLGKRGEVRLLDSSQEILKTFTPATRAAAYKALARRGVRVSLETKIMRIERDCVAIAQLGQTAILPADLVLWAAGMQMSDWVKNLDCSHNEWGQLLSSPTLQLVDYPEVFALGDVAEMIDAAGQRVPATAQAAYQQASCAARNVRASLKHKRLKRFRYLHLGEMIALGVNDAAISSFGFSLRGAIAALIRSLVYLQRLPTLAHRLQVLWHWLTIALKNCLKLLARFGRRKKARIRKGKPQTMLDDSGKPLATHPKSNPPTPLCPPLPGDGRGIGDIHNPKS
jgi:demethylphylloquinone reductase